MRIPRITRKVHFTCGRNGRKILEDGKAPETPEIPEGTIPRITRLMALAIRFDKMLNEGQIDSRAELAELGHVTRARVTQVMNLLNLAPDIQEEILFLPRTVKGSDPVTERHVRPVCAIMEWDKQRKKWAGLLQDR